MKDTEGKPHRIDELKLKLRYRMALTFSQQMHEKHLAEIAFHKNTVNQRYALARSIVRLVVMVVFFLYMV